MFFYLYILFRCVYLVCWHEIVTNYEVIGVLHYLLIIIILIIM